MSLLKLIPPVKSYLWGGTKLKEHYGKTSPNDIIAETWELSCHPDGESIIGEGPYFGETLSSYIHKESKGVLGRNCDNYENFPILVKLIDASKSLSIQVHPDDAYALSQESQYGKTELWYIVDCEEGAYIYYGVNRKISQEEFESKIAGNSVTEILNKVAVKPGDVFFIPAGTIHALCEGITVAEIQQSSNVTYRIYDYNRKEPDGSLRPLHIEKAVAVANLTPLALGKRLEGDKIARCPYFEVDKFELSAPFAGIAGSGSFHHLLFLEGQGMVSARKGNGEALTYSKGDSIFIPANTGAYTITGTGHGLVTRIP